MAELITSPSNSKIKLARSLRQRTQRLATGLFLVEGIHPVGQAAEAGGYLEFICYAPELLTSQYARRLVERQSEAGVPCYPVSGRVLASLTEKENPQGIVAVAHQKQESLVDLNPGNCPWGVGLVNAQDPGNVGSILRTIDAVGASGLLLLDNGVDAIHPSAVRASMGAIFWHPIAQASFAEFKSWAGKHNYTICGASARGKQDYRSIEYYPLPLILLLGSEREGLTEDQRKACDILIRLPMQGYVTSLNLSVAAGILLYAIQDKLVVK